MRRLGFAKITRPPPGSCGFGLTAAFAAGSSAPPPQPARASTTSARPARFTPLTFSELGGEPAIKQLARLALDVRRAEQDGPELDRPARRGDHEARARRVRVARLDAGRPVIALEQQRVVVV